MSDPDDRWIEAIDQHRRASDERWIYDRTWLDRQQPYEPYTDQCAEVPRRLENLSSGLNSAFNAYPVLYVLPVLAIGTVTFVLVILILTS